MRTRSLTKHETLALTVIDLIVQRDGGPIHGYPVARQIQRIEPADQTMNYATFYRILARLTEQGLLSKETAAQGIGPGRPRQYYLLTEAGQQEVAESGLEVEIDDAGVLRVRRDA